MSSRRFVYWILIISLLIFSVFVCYQTILPKSSTIVFPGEGVYSGQLRGQIFHGQGIWEGEFGITYTGEFKNGYFHGTGTMTFANGATYEGEFKQGYMHGHGVMTFPDGHTHEGVWDNSEFLGDHEDCNHDH